MESKKQPLISIVIPIYKPQYKYIKEAIISSLSQSYGNFEIIISDDNPIEDTVIKSVLSEIGNEKTKYYINKSSKGIFSNLNNAIKQSNGEYIQILCQDDILYSSCIEIQYNTLLKYPQSGFVYSQANQIDDQGRLFKSYQEKFEVLNMYRHSQDTINLFFKYGCLPGNLSPVMIPKKIIEEVGEFNQNLPYAGDFDYWVRIVEKGWGMSVNLPPLLEIRSHDQRASVTIGKKIWIKDIVIVYSKILDLTKFKRSKLYKLLYINEKIGIQSLKISIKFLIVDFNIASLKILTKYPFSLVVILILSIFTQGGKYNLFKIPEIKFNQSQ